MASVDTYEDLFQQANAKDHWLRSTRGTTSCKLSALVYILIHLMMGKVPSPRIPIITRKIMSDINKFNPDTPSIRDLKQILLNRSIKGTVISDTSFLKGNMWYVGLVKKSQDLTLDVNVIDHYFVIVQKEDGTFKTVSSYGCSRVYIKQYETDLNLEEFDAFIKALNQDVRTRRSEQVIRNFMIKHFLHLEHYVEKEVEPDENDGRTTTSPELRDSEVEDYVTSKYHMEYYPVIDTLQTMIDGELRGGMRKKKTRKGKRRQSRYSKKNKYI
jgi:hypothetical protein